jgi:hypothetical protein
MFTWYQQIGGKEKHNHPSSRPVFIMRIDATGGVHVEICGFDEVKQSALFSLQSVSDIKNLLSLIQGDICPGVADFTGKSHIWCLQPLLDYNWGNSVIRNRECKIFSPTIGKSGVVYRCAKCNKARRNVNRSYAVYNAKSVEEIDRLIEPSRGKTNMWLRRDGILLNKLIESYKRKIDLQQKKIHRLYHKFIEDEENDVLCDIFETADEDGNALSMIVSKFTRSNAVKQFWNEQRNAVMKYRENKKNGIRWSVLMIRPTL